AQVLGERREQADGTPALVLGGLARAIRIGRALDEDRVLANVRPSQRPQFPRAESRVGEKRDDQRVPLPGGGLTRRVELVPSPVSLPDLGRGDHPRWRIAYDGTNPLNGLGRERLDGITML